MAAVSEDISDYDLRAKLKEHGINVGPITSTTRNVYIRKLNTRLTGIESGLKSAAKNTSRKSLSPRRSPGRSPARDTSRRSAAVDTSSPSKRKLVGFSSDEEEANKEVVVPKPSRLSRKASPATDTAHHCGEERHDLPRFRKHVNTPMYNYKRSEDDEKTAIDGRDTIPRDYDEFKRIAAKLSPYSSLKQLFLRKSMEDSQKSSERTPSQPPPEMSYDIDDEDETEGNVYTRVWLLLLLVAVLLILFFNWEFIIALLWKPGANSKTLKICGPISSNSKTEACLKEEEYVKILLEKLEFELAEKAGLVQCGYLTKGGEMKVDELKDWITNSNRDSNHTRMVESMIKRVVNTSDYALSFLFANGTVATDKSGEIATVKVTLVRKPLFCRIKEAFSKVMFQLVVLFVVLVIGLCIYFFVKYRWRLRERKTRQMFHLVDQILNVLKEHHNECQRNKDLSPCLAIPHVRDMLIKPSERESMKHVWDQAVKFLSAKDSRVRVESQRIAGEDFEVWRLLHHSSPSSKTSSAETNEKEEKVWQGQAFENFQSAVNPPLISPTPCLKIRNMFEPVMETREQWHIFIQDAILEKCNEKRADIVHIAVDQLSNEGCVYVKCANHLSSGIAFRSIHGCWFDGRLITVKFLTLKRYHQRFPESAFAKQPIKPSGTSSSTIPKLKSEPINESDSDSETEGPVVT